ncbi:MAG: radical SAM protein [Candidatus Woesearchaeota archaeon]
MKTLFLGLPSLEKYSHISPPIGLCYLSAMLKKNDFPSKILDCSSRSWKEIERILLREKPDILGIQCLTIERGQAFKLAKMARHLLPSVKIVFGGQHASCFPEHMFKLAPIDYVVIGEGELTIVELVRAINEGKTSEKHLSKIKGLAFRKSDRSIQINEKRLLIENLDELPFPDYSTLNFKQYCVGAFREPSIPILTSRGCPYNCAFCSSTNYWQHRFRARSAENVLTEIEYLYQRGTRNLAFYDDNFIVNKQRLIDICQGIINRGMKIRFTVASSVKIIDDERLMWLKKAGCFSVGFGVESGSPKILKAINKFQTPEDIKRAFALVRKYGMTPGGSLIVGCPGEDDKTLKETADLLNEIEPERLSYAGILWILPGTPIYELSKQQSIMSDDTWLKTNNEIFYTGEYTLKQLKVLQRKLLLYQVKNRNFRQKIGYLVWWVHLSSPAFLKRFFRSIYYSFLRIKLGA